MYMGSTNWTQCNIKKKNKENGIGKGYVEGGIWGKLECRNKDIYAPNILYACIKFSNNKHHKRSILKHRIIYYTKIKKY